MQTIPIHGSEGATINIPDRLINVQPYFWRDEDHIEAFKANPDMDIITYTEALPIDNYGQGNVQTTLLLDHFEMEREALADGGIEDLWDAYEDDWEFRKAERKQELVSDRKGTNANRSVDEDQIVEFRAVVTEDHDRSFTLPASVAHEDREYHGFPEHTEFSAGVTAMRLLEEQSSYFPLYDALECVNGYDWTDPPIVVEATRADGSVHLRYEFTAFEFDRAVLEDGESYPTYYLGEKEREAEKGEECKTTSAGPPHDKASAQKFLDEHVKIIHVKPRPPKPGTDQEIER